VGERDEGGGREGAQEKRERACARKRDKRVMNKEREREREREGKRERKRKREK